MSVTSNVSYSGLNNQTSLYISRNPFLISYFGIANFTLNRLVVKRPFSVVKHTKRHNLYCFVQIVSTFVYSIINITVNVKLSGSRLISMSP